MSIEGPFLSAIIARLGDAKYNLAAYGVSFSLALIIESPIIMIMTASTALIDGKEALKKLFAYTLMLNVAITALMLILLIPSIFSYLTDDLMELPEEVSKLTYYATLFLLPWPAAIGFRRFYQGIMIRHNITRRVTYGTVIRLSGMLGMAMLLYYQFSLPGAYIGSLALSSGVVFEAVASRFMVHKVLKKIKEKPSVAGRDLSYGKINKFYYPLALTSILSLSVHPVVTFFMGQSRMAIESLAVLPVINSFVFLLRSLGLSFQEVVIAKVGLNFENYKPLRNFVLLLMSGVTLIIGTAAFTPLAAIWYNVVAGLSHELTLFALLPTKILILIPASAVWISLQRGLLVVHRMTEPITWATVIELTVIIAVMFVGIKYLNGIGVVVAAVSFVSGRAAANLYLLKYQLKIGKL